MRHLGIMLLAVGSLTAAVGLVLLLAPRLPWLGHLPGDIHYEGKNSSFHFPIVTCIVLSIILTVLLNIVVRLFRK